jgi:hypothetical protein
MVRNIGNNSTVAAGTSSCWDGSNSRDQIYIKDPEEETNALRKTATAGPTAAEYCRELERQGTPTTTGTPESVKHLNGTATKCSITQRLPHLT